MKGQLCRKVLRYNLAPGGSPRLANISSHQFHLSLVWFIFTRTKSVVWYLKVSMKYYSATLLILLFLHKAIALSKTRALHMHVPSHSHASAHPIWSSPLWSYLVCIRLLHLGFLLFTKVIFLSIVRLFLVTDTIRPKLSSLPCTAACFMPCWPIYADLLTTPAPLQTRPLSLARLWSSPSLVSSSAARTYHKPDTSLPYPSTVPYLNIAPACTAQCMLSPNTLV